MGWWLVFAIFLYFACAGLLIAEVFVPSGGIITICALACLIGGLAIFYNHSTAALWVGIIIAVVMIPSVLIGAYKVFPKTRFGKSVTLTPPQRQQGDAIPDTDKLKELLKDDWMDIRVVAAESLSYLDQRNLALETLEPIIKNEPEYVSLAAMNALDFMHQAGHVSLKRIRKLLGDTEFKGYPKRMADYFQAME